MRQVHANQMVNKVSDVQKGADNEAASVLCLWKIRICFSPFCRQSSRCTARTETHWNDLLRKQLVGEQWCHRQSSCRSRTHRQICSKGRPVYLLNYKWANLKIAQKQEPLRLANARHLPWRGGRKRFKSLPFRGGVKNQPLKWLIFDGRVCAVWRKH